MLKENLYIFYFSLGECAVTAAKIVAKLSDINVSDIISTWIIYEWKWFSFANNYYIGVF